jgi:membrane protease YdiL (CAAX protease family)
MFIHTANRYYTNFIASLSKQKTSILILYTVGLDIIVTLIFSIILFPNHTAGPVHTSNTEKFFVAVLVGPFIETLLFQDMLIKFILKKRANARLLSCLVSAILFALLHYYSWQYILKTFFSGLFFGSLYLIITHKRQNPLLVVFIAHAIYNGIGLIVDILNGAV